MGLIASSQLHVNADIPALPAQVQALFEPDAGFGILDVGGDPSGARVLARYRRGLEEAGVRLLCVVNANRPLTHTADQAIRYLEQIQATAGFPVGGLVNNTHLCGQTEPEDILRGLSWPGRYPGAPAFPCCATRSGRRCSPAPSPA